MSDDDRGEILCSIHDPAGDEVIRVGVETTVTLRIRNALAEPVRLGTRVDDQRIVIHFEELDASASFDAAGVRCEGFAARVLDDGGIELTPTWREHWWFPQELLVIELPKFRIDGATGPGFVLVDLEQFGENADGRYGALLMKLGPARGVAADVAVHWNGTPRVDIETNNTLALTINAPSGGRFYVTLASGNASGRGLLALVSDARDVQLAASDAYATERIASGDLPVWKLAPHNAGELAVTLESIRSRRPAGFAHIVVHHLDVPNADDGFTVLAAQLAAASVQIRKFTVDPPLLTNITAPATVNLAWDVVGATTVTLSGYGVVPPKQVQLAMAVEETTTFVLTAYDSTLSQVVAEKATVVCDPPLAQRLVPRGTIALWSGFAKDIPDHWRVCDGVNGPDLRDRFVVGAAPGGELAKGDADTHTHENGPFSQTIFTSEVPDHKHKFPSNWYWRDYREGNFAGIDTRVRFDANKTTTEGSGAHRHSVTVSTKGVKTGPNIGSIRPPWFALCYIIKVD